MPGREGGAGSSSPPGDAMGARLQGGEWHCGSPRVLVAMSPAQAATGSRHSTELGGVMWVIPAPAAQPCSWGFCLRVLLPCVVPQFPLASSEAGELRGSGRWDLLVVGCRGREASLCMGDVLAAHVL